MANDANTPGTTARLARWVVGVGREAIPAVAVARAKEAFVDFLAVAVAGSREPGSQIARSLAVEQGGAPQATVIGAGRRLSATWAAFANGTAAHALDYDDASLTMLGHPSAVVAPAALALAEWRGATGWDLLAAYLVGLEVCAKFGAGLAPAHYRRGWQTTPTIGTVGAAAAAAHLLRLSVEPTQVALGLAASFSFGLRQQAGTMAKFVYAGEAARTALAVALLAEKGLTSAPDAIEGVFGFCRTFNGEGNYDLERMVSNLGDPFDVVEPGLVLKCYPGCAFLHPALEGLLDILQTHSLRAEDVAAVECEVDSVTPTILRYPDPMNSPEARFSLQYSLAAAVADGGLGLAQYRESRVGDPALRSLMQRIHLRPRPDDPSRISSLETTVTVRCVDGAAHTRHVPSMRGAPERPQSAAELAEKFRRCADGTLSQAAIEQALALVGQLEELADLRELGGLLTGSPIPSMAGGGEGW